jgi:hypothetical protein
MNCFTHQAIPAVGLCVSCQKGVCRDCVGRAAPRVVCRTCTIRGGMIGYEYKSAAAIGSWPLIHVCMGIDPVTMRPRVARGVIAIGNFAVGLVAVGGVACGLFAVGGVALGLLAALGGLALGAGVSVGGVAVGSVAIGGAALGFVHAIGGAAAGRSVIDGVRCDADAREFARQWLSAVALPSCR